MTPEQIAKNSEHSQQAALFCWCNINIQLFPELKWFYAIPNGGDRDKITAGKLKAEGVKSGVLDCFLGVARKGFHGLYIEMKKPGMEKSKNCGLSDNQIEFGNFATSQGYKCCVCYSWVEARNILVEYLS